MMSKRITGGLFCLTSAVLYAARLLCSAIYISGIKTWDRRAFLLSLRHIGVPLLIFSIIALLVGIGYLVLAELEDRRKWSK